MNLIGPSNPIVPKSEKAKEILDLIVTEYDWEREQSYRSQEFRDKLLDKVKLEDVIDAIESIHDNFLRASALRTLAMVPYKLIESYAEKFASSLFADGSENFETLYDFYCSLNVLLYFDNPYGILQFAELEKQMLALPPYQGRIDPRWFVETREEVAKWKMYRAQGLRWEQEPED
jgi:hypothetical protein